MGRSIQDIFGGLRPELFAVACCSLMLFFRASSSLGKAKRAQRRLSPRNPRGESENVELNRPRTGETSDFFRFLSPATRRPGISEPLFQELPAMQLAQSSLIVLFCLNAQPLLEPGSRSIPSQRLLDQIFSYLD